MDNSIYSSELLKPIENEDIDNYIKNREFVVRKHSKDVILHFEGEPCTMAEIIITGKIVVERIDESGGLMTVAEFINDDLLGGNLIFSKNPYYPMTVTTKESCTVLEVKKDVLFNLFLINPEFLHTYLEYISDHATMLGDKIKHYVNRTIRESVLSFLEHERKIQNSKIIKLNMSKKALAEKIGIQRTSLSRELTKMKNDGLIDYDSKSITLLKNNDK